MNKDDIAYAAGLFDAEGCITIAKRKDKTMLVPCHCLRVSLGVMHRPTLNWLKNNFGGSIQKDGKQTICLKWIIASNIAANFLQKIIGNLQIKKLQAKLALQFQDKMRNRNEYRVSLKSFQHREEFRNQISLLNRQHSGIELSNEYKIAYIAGFLDGDGCISIPVSKIPTNPHHYLRITIVSINKLIIYWLQDNFGGFVYIRKPYFDWKIDGRSAANILRRALPHLQIKSKQAKLALQFRKEKEQNHWRRLTVKTLQRREQYRQQMLVLNRNS